MESNTMETKLSRPKAFYFCCFFLAIFKTCPSVANGEQLNTITETYPTAAKRIIPLHIHKVLSSIDKVSASTLPHEIKDMRIRKAVGQLRAYLDFFQYVYPTFEKADPWKRVRKLLDEGYQHLGEFKDLFDTSGISREEITKKHYPEAQLLKSRSLVLLWVKKFQTIISQESYQNYFSHPLQRSLEFTGDRKASKYYWRGVTKLPEHDSSLQMTLRQLCAERLDYIAEKFDGTWGLEDITDPLAQQNFHHFRKSLRSILKLKNYFPSIVIFQLNLPEISNYNLKFIESNGTQ